MEQKLALMKIKAALNNEKRERAAERKELEQKLALDNEKRDRAAELKEMEQKLALDNEKRDRAAERKEMEQKLALDNEKRDRETKEMQHQLEIQIQQLKWESRLGQLEQQLSIQPRYTPSIMAPIDPAQQMINPTPMQHLAIETEQRLIQQLLETKLQKSEYNQPQLPFLGPTPQTAPQESMAGPVAGPSSRLQDTTTPRGSNGSAVAVGTAKAHQSALQTDAVASLASPLQGSTGSSDNAFFYLCSLHIGVSTRIKGLHHLQEHDTTHNSMSSGETLDQMAALLNKITLLEIKQKMAALENKNERRSRQAKELEQKIEQRLGQKM
jgi:hypothetical protein